MIELIKCFQAIPIELLSQLISIITPIVLLLWFYYSQKQSQSRNYYNEILGVYAGFTEPMDDHPQKNGINAGIIMTIRDIDTQGFFKGEFDFGETRLTLIDGIPTSKPLRVGIHMFFGKMNYKLLQLNKNGHPFRPKENRTYYGKLYIVNRLDFQFEKYDIDDYLDAEYDIFHYREMQTLKFTLNKIHKKESPKIPKSFTLYKSVGFSFEPLKGVKEVVFKEMLQ